MPSPKNIASRLLRKMHIASVTILVFSVSTIACAKPTIQLNKIGAFPVPVDVNDFDESAAEIIAYDTNTQRAFVVNANDATIDVLDISTPSTPTLALTIDVTAHGKVANSVAVAKNIVAVAVENSNKQLPGKVVFYDTSGSFLSTVEVGSLPDMLTFTPNKKWVLVANEGEPDDSYTIDPEGSVSIIDVSGNISKLTQNDVRTASLEKFNNAKLDDSIRIFGPNASVAQDLEPEYIAAAFNSKKAWVSFQENNAIGILDIKNAEFKALVGLGFKDHSLEGNELDASNKDGGINITNWPVLGMYQPDAIAEYKVRGKSFIVMANEGDSRDYAGYSEEERIKKLTLDPVAFPNAADLQLDENLGRLKSTTATGDLDGDGDHDVLFSYGARSFSILNARGKIIYDSGSDIEKRVAAALPGEFNSNNDENDSFDNRSDDKGPEPEGITIGKVAGQTYAFIGLERVGGIIVYNITNPWNPGFVQYINSRDFTGDPEAGTAGDLGPEGIIFISADDSPTDKPLLLVGNEVSGTTAVFEISLTNN